MAPKRRLAAAAATAADRMAPQKRARRSPRRSPLLATLTAVFGKNGLHGRPLLQLIESYATPFQIQHIRTIENHVGHSICRGERNSLLTHSITDKRFYTVDLTTGQITPAPVTTLYARDQFNIRLDGDNPGSYYYFLDEHRLDHIQRYHDATTNQDRVVFAMDRHGDDWYYHEAYHPTEPLFYALDAVGREGPLSTFHLKTGALVAKVIPQLSDILSFPQRWRSLTVLKDKLYVLQFNASDIEPTTLRSIVPTTGETGTVWSSPGCVATLTGIVGTPYIVFICLASPWESGWQACALHVDTLAIETLLCCSRPLVRTRASAANPMRHMYPAGENTLQIFDEQPNPPSSIAVDEQSRTLLLLYEAGLKMYQGGLKTMIRQFSLPPHLFSARN